jgi:hypothetical protein
MKLTATTLALLGFLSTYGTLAHADSQSSDYTACVSEVKATFPDHGAIKIKRMRSSSMDLWVNFPGSERLLVRCDRTEKTIALKDGTPIKVAKK